MFITLEGPEGAGKTTQALLLAEYLKAEGREVVLTREPGGTRIGQEIRSMLLNSFNQELDFLTELLLYAADRSQHVAEVIRPALIQGKTVICDRYIHSMIAYQCYGRGLSRQVVDDLNKIAVGGVWPDITFVLDLPVEAGLERASNRRAKDRIEQEKLEFHQRVRNGFLELALADRRLKVIKADENQEYIFAKIKNLLLAYNEEGEPSCG